MAKSKMYNMEGNIVGEVSLPAKLFEVKINSNLVHEAMVAAQANVRKPIAHTKMRGEVSGGGKKPWRQKGTGRARHGSIRSPLWVGGGVTFGPRNTRSFGKKINRQARRKALCMVFSDKFANDKVIVLDVLKLAEAKTKQLAGLLKRLPIGKRVMIILPGSNKEMMRASHNLQKVMTVTANSVPFLELLRYDTVLMPQDTIKKLEELYTK